MHNFRSVSSHDAVISATNMIFRRGFEVTDSGDARMTYRKNSFVRSEYKSSDLRGYASEREPGPVISSVV